VIKLTDIELVSTPQSFFDSFNQFIMSNDTKVFNKLIARAFIYDKVKDVPGDIVECGVFKGSGVYTFLKLKRLLNPNSSKRVIGFDFFDTTELLKSLNNEQDIESMKVLFSGRDFVHEQSFEETLNNKIMADGFEPREFLLVQGDVCKTTRDFVRDNPGFKISLLYMDVDLEVPTYETLINLWDNISKGGMIVFDEYGFHKWSESKGADRFIDEKSLEIKHLDYISPSAYILKK
jgi:hypothetical protein